MSILTNGFAGRDAGCLLLPAAARIGNRGRVATLVCFAPAAASDYRLVLPVRQRSVFGTGRRVDTVGDDVADACVVAGAFGAD